MIQETVARVRGEGFAAPIVISGQEHRFLIAEQMRAAGVDDARIILEPAGRNTAPAAAIAALKVLEDDPDGLLLLMPSDHVVRDVKAFHAAVAVAAKAARQRRAGDIRHHACRRRKPAMAISGAAQPLEGVPGAFAVERFVEKPDRATAEGYLASGGYYWNSGMFLFSAKAFLAEMERLEPGMLAFCRDAIAHAHRDMDFIRLGEVAFLACPSQSIDYAVMEHAANAAVVPVEMGWSDVGSWQSLWDISPRDAGRQCDHGRCDRREHAAIPISAAKARWWRRWGWRIWSWWRPRMRCWSATATAPRTSRRSWNSWKPQGRDHHIHHAVVHRPWGSYESVDAGERFQVKRIIVNPGAKLSLQMHHQRAEHWIVVSGTAHGDLRRQGVPAAGE